MRIIYRPEEAFIQHNVVFELLGFDVLCGMVTDDQGIQRSRVKVNFKCNLGGQVLEGERTSRRTEPNNADIGREPDGPYDIMRDLLVDLIIQQWPAIAQFLEKETVVDGIVLHEIHSKEYGKPHISATWKCMIGLGKKRVLEFNAGCESQNSISAMVKALFAAYKLIVFRWLKMEEARQRATARIRFPPPPRRKRHSPHKLK